MKYNMVLSEFPFNKIKYEGRKVDIRLFDKKRQQLKINDLIDYENFSSKEHLVCEVKGIAIFDNFSDLVDFLTPEMIGYDNKEEVIIRLNRAYPLEEQKKFNVMGIFIKEVPSVMREKFRTELER